MSVLSDVVNSVKYTSWMTRNWAGIGWRKTIGNRGAPRGKATLCNDSCEVASFLIEFVARRGAARLASSCGESGVRLIRHGKRNTLQYNTYNALQYNTIQYNTI